LVDGSTAKSDAAAVPAWSQAFIDGLRLVNRAQLDFWSGYLERAWGVDRRRPVPRSTEESFLLQVEYVHAVLRAHTLEWSRLPTLSPPGPRRHQPRESPPCSRDVPPEHPRARHDPSVGQGPRVSDDAKNSRIEPHAGMAEPVPRL
jgi:hypothetical protein